MKIALIAILLILLVSFYLSFQLLVPVTNESSLIEIEIPRGASYKKSLSIIVEKGLMRDSFIFLLIGKVYGIDKKLRAGFYLFKGRMTPWQVFKKLLAGEVIEYWLCIKEGETLFDIAEKLKATGLVDYETFISLAYNKDFLESLSIRAPSLEGYLYPDTYRLPKGASPEYIISIMVNKLRKEYAGKLKEREKELGLTENEVLTLASIIEREAIVDEERAIISAVYHNRLKIGMPLQADPTAVYGIKPYDQKITKEDLKVNSRYNTYRIRGLPPGPIASPSIKSIIAALYPAEVPYLYFVSKGDGTHIFSKTLKEHNIAVNKVRSQRGNSINGSSQN
ncbi:MAG: endolytic transglycosylase MltG [Thermodesulfovibrionales bacterium]|nr:endolytic transglycosylase MltG [Thermodesulfovibrionales bacterium]